MSRFLACGTNQFSTPGANIHKLEQPDYEQLRALCSHVNTFSETHFLKHSPYSEGNSDSTSQEILSILWYPEVHYLFT
jgi:hypothetical protein